MQVMNAEIIIKKLGLIPHPEEGGYYRETYRSAESIQASSLDPRYGESRSQKTAIYYLLTADTYSKIHRLKSDELFHFYLGDPVEMLIVPSDAEYCETARPATPFGRHILGQDLDAEQNLQILVPRGCWQGARLCQGGEFALLGCTVSPGFEFQDFSTDAPDTLPTEFQEHHGLYQALK